MRFPLACVALATLTVVAPLSIRAQEPAAPATISPVAPPPGPPKFLNQNVRIDVTIALKGDAKPLTKNLSMVASDGRETKGRSGIEIPVATSFAPGSTAPQTFQYRPVGVNVDATPQILDATHALLRMNIQFSTVYKPEGGSGSQPSFGQGSHEVRGIVFESGKPVVVTQAADGETGREYTVEVKATILK